MTAFESYPTRRDFMGAAALGLAAITTLGTQVARSEEKPIPDPFRGLKVGVASYSFRKFSLDQSIEMMKKLQLKYITLKDFHLAMKSTREERQAAAKKLKDAGLILMGGGVIYLKNNETEVRNAFEYCRDAGMPVMVSAPELDALPLVDKMVKEFDIKVAIHNHGPGDKRYPSPMDAYKAAAPFDKRIGCCIDIGHTVRIGEDEIEAIHKVKDRLYDFHMKDVSSRTAEGDCIEVGRGVINIPGVLKALKEINFAGHVALEYEIHENDPLPGMIESFAYIRGVLATM